jgi:hypothetical protein
MKRRAFAVQWALAPASTRQPSRSSRQQQRF